MRKFLTRLDSGYALVIDNSVLELLDIRPDTPLEIGTDGDTLLISPLRHETESERAKAQKLVDAKQRIFEKYATTFRKLAE